MEKLDKHWMTIEVNSWPDKINYDHRKKEQETNGIALNFFVWQIMEVNLIEFLVNAGW